MDESECAICEVAFRPGERVCFHSGCSARFHRACYDLAASTIADIKCTVCDRCWVFTRDEVLPHGGSG